MSRKAKRKAKRQVRRNVRKVKRHARQKKATVLTRKAVTRVKDTARKIVDKAKQIGGFAILAPISPVLKAGLRARGLSTSGTLQEVAIRFYNEVVRKNSYDEFNTFGSFYDNVEQAQEPEVKINNIEPATISIIVTAIVSFVKKLKAKKEQGEPLTKTQQKIVDTSDTLNKEIEEVAKDEIEMRITDGIKKYWWVAVVGIVAFMYTKKK